MFTRLLPALLLLSASPALAQLKAYTGLGAFNTPDNKPYIETYFTFVGNTLATRPRTDGLHNSVQVNVSIGQDNRIVRSERYNVTGPAFQGKAPAFIDVQRYALADGAYNMHFVLKDNFDEKAKPVTIDIPFDVRFNADSLQLSDILPLESFHKAAKPGPLTKSGFDLVPYNSSYYPETVRELSFYAEVYNSAKRLGENEPFIFKYYLETSSGELLPSHSGFRKMQTAAAAPVIGRLDISKVGTGDYYLVCEVVDRGNQVRLREKYPFRRNNRMVDVASLQELSEKESIAAFVGHVQNADTLRMFVECLWPIADNVDKERIINQSLRKDPDLMRKFVADFWTRRAGDTANPVKLWGAYYRNVQQVMQLFKCGKQKGYYTERGRVYLQYGPPSQRSQQPNEQNSFPYEIWQYYRLTDGTNGQFYSNRKFVFVNKMLGDDCYNLVHSDMRGEINNPRWQFELTRRNNNGLSNPDNNTPAGTEFNHFNEIYNNPR